MSHCACGWIVPKMHEENAKQAQSAQNYEKLKELCNAATKP